MARLVNNFTRLPGDPRQPSVHMVWAGTLSTALEAFQEMRYFALAFVASALVACGGDKNKAADSAAAPADSASAVAPAPTTTTAAGSATAAPATGTVHEVKMVGDDKGYRFEPAELTIKQGDGVKFVMTSGGPHNVAFDEAGIPTGASAQLAANIENAAAPLTSQMLVNPNEAVTVSFANVPAGTYNYNCIPHLAMGMKGKITVQ
jgi:plastocyanin